MTEPATASGMKRLGFRDSSPRTAAASKPMKDRIPKTTPRPTPEKPFGAELGEKAERVFPFPAFAMAIVAKSKKTMTSMLNNVRSTRTDVLMLRTDRIVMTAMKMKAYIHHGKSALKVVCT